LFATNQEIPRISRNPKVHYRTHKLPPPVSSLGPPNPLHIPTSHLLEIHPNIIHPSTPRPPQWSLSLRLVWLYHNEMPVLKKMLAFLFSANESYTEDRGSAVSSVTLLLVPLYTKLHFNCPKYQKNSLGESSPLCYRHLGRGGVRQNTTVLYPIYCDDDDMFRALWDIFRSQKYTFL